MNATLLAIVLASSVAAPAPAEEAIKPPQGMQPAQVIVSMTRGGEFDITQAVIVPVTVFEERTIIVGGMPVKQAVTVTKYAAEVRKYRMKAEGVKFYTAGGKEVNATDAADKLKQPTIVLLANDGNKVDPFYLKIIKPDTLVIVMAAPAPTPAPPPDKPKPEKPR